MGIKDRMQVFYSLMGFSGLNILPFDTLPDLWELVAHRFILLFNYFNLLSICIFIATRIPDLISWEIDALIGYFVLLSLRSSGLTLGKACSSSTPPTAQVSETAACDPKNVCNQSLRWTDCRAIQILSFVQVVLEVTLEVLQVCFAPGLLVFPAPHQFVNGNLWQEVYHSPTKFTVQLLASTYFLIIQGGSRNICAIQTV